MMQARMAGQNVTHNQAQMQMAHHRPRAVARVITARRPADAGILQKEMSHEAK